MRAEPVPGVPYLRTLQRPSGTWWRLIVAVIAGVVGLFFMATLAAVVVIVVARLTVDPDYAISISDGVDAGELLATNLGLAGLIPVAWALSRLLYGVRPPWLSSHRPGFRWAWLWIAVGASAVVWSLFWSVGTIVAFAERDDPIDSGVVAFVLVVLLTTPIQAAGEEYLFRGILLQSLGATRMPQWLACGISAALFATAHLQFDPPLFADRFLLGVVLAYLVIKTGGLEASIAIHAVKNISVFIPAGILEQTEDAIDPTGVTWVPLALDAVLLAIVVPWLLYLFNNRRGRFEPQAGAEAVLPGVPWQADQARPAPGLAPPQPSPGFAQPPPPQQPPNWQPPPRGWKPPPPRS